MLQPSSSPSQPPPSQPLPSPTTQPHSRTQRRRALRLRRARRPRQPLQLPNRRHQRRLLPPVLCRVACPQCLHRQHAARLHRPAPQLAGGGRPLPRCALQRAGNALCVCGRVGACGGVWVHGCGWEQSACRQCAREECGGSAAETGYVIARAESNEQCKTWRRLEMEGCERVARYTHTYAHSLLEQAPPAQ